MSFERLFHPGPAQLGHGDALLGGQLHDEAAQPFLGRKSAAIPSHPYG